MDFDPVDILSLIVAISAVIFSLILFYKQRKSDQFRIFFDIEDRRDRNLFELREIYRNLNKPETQKTFIEEKASNSLQSLNLLEFFSLLVNTKEISNRRIISYYKRVVEEEAEQVFTDYPNIKKEDFEELDKLLKKYKNHEF